MFTQHPLCLIGLYRSCLLLVALLPEQSDPMTYVQKGLINRHSAYHSACLRSKERLPAQLCTFTIRSPSGQALLLVSPLTFMLPSTQSLVGAVSNQRFSEPTSLESHKCVPVNKTDGQESNQRWSFKMHHSEYAE